MKTDPKTVELKVGESVRLAGGQRGGRRIVSMSENFVSLAGVLKPVGRRALERMIAQGRAEILR